MVKTSISAGGVVLNRHGDVLVVNQRGNSWSLPKGHVDPGEEILAAARREILEESGISDLQLLRKLGVYERHRIAKDGKSISIKNPDGGRNIKLKGMIYERDFKRENLANLGREQTKKPTNRSELQAINQRERDKRQHRLEQRFAKHRGADRQLEQQLGREFNEAQSRATATSPEPAQSINGQSERAEPSSQPYERIGVTDSDNLPDQRERQSQEYDAKRGGGKQNSGQSEQNRFTNHSARNDPR